MVNLERILLTVALLAIPVGSLIAYLQQDQIPFWVGVIVAAFSAAVAYGVGVSEDEWQS